MAMNRKLMVMGLAVLLCLAGAQTVGISPTSAQTPTPGTGSVSGRVYVDVDANGAFGGPDAPLALLLELFLTDVSGPAFARMNSSSDGTYRFADLPPGNYRVMINVPIPSCVVPIQPFTWVGDTFSGFSCPVVRLTTQELNIAVAPGEDVTGADFPQIPQSYDVTARIWVNAAALSPANRVVVTAGGNSCWDAQVTPTVTAAEIEVSFYSAKLAPSADPACHGGDLDILVDGRPMGATTNWNEFWKESLASFGPRPLNQSSDVPPYLSSADLAAPPFQGITGQVVEASTVTPQNVSQNQGTLVPDGTRITAFVGNTACGETRTKALTGPQGQFGGNLFGLIVPPASVKAGCGAAGAAVTFCIGEFKARQPAAGPFSYFQSPEAKPVQWAAPSLADITLEPTTEPCLAAEASPGPGPEPLPVSLPATGGRPKTEA